MTAQIAGILLNNGTLRTEWFFYLATFVAFNTIVFVGLSIGRFVYWPRHLLIVGSGSEDGLAQTDPADADDGPDS